jgi:hypothetical protein
VADVDPVVKSGSAIDVQLMRTDVEQGFIDFKRVG